MPAKKNGFDLEAAIATAGPRRNSLRCNRAAYDAMALIVKRWSEGAPNLNWVWIRNVLVEHYGCTKGLTGQTVQRFAEREWPTQYEKIRAQRR